jgi:molecular chaperone GrpE (heat shock protein)
MNSIAPEGGTGMAATLPQRLQEAWRVLRGDASASPPSPSGEAARAAEEARLTAETAVAALRLELEEAHRRGEALRREVDAERAARADAVAAGMAARLEPLLTDAAALLGQLALQARLLEEGKPVGASDVLALAGALAHLFERQGLIALAAAGDREPYDPARHQPLGQASPAAGTEVVVRIPGYRLAGKILRKSMVEPARPA